MPIDTWSTPTLHPQCAVDSGEFGVRSADAFSPPEITSGSDQSQCGSGSSRRFSDDARQRHRRRPAVSTRYSKRQWSAGKCNHKIRRKVQNKVLSIYA